MGTERDVGVTEVPPKGIMGGKNYWNTGILHIEVAIAWVSTFNITAPLTCSLSLLSVAPSMRR